MELASASLRTTEKVFVNAECLANFIIQKPFQGVYVKGAQQVRSFATKAKTFEAYQHKIDLIFELLKNKVRNSIALSNLPMIRQPVLICLEFYIPEMFDPTKHPTNFIQFKDALNGHSYYEKVIPDILAGDKLDGVSRFMPKGYTVIEDDNRNCVLGKTSLFINSETNILNVLLYGVNFFTTRHTLFM